MTGLRLEIDLVSIVTNGDVAPKLHLEKFLPYRLSVLSNTVSSAIAAAYFMNFGLSIPGVARHGGAGGELPDCPPPRSRRARPWTRSP